MRHESLVKLIGSLDPAAFLEVARRCLLARGYQPALSDGPYDGGADFLVYVRGMERAPCAVQLSREKDWKKKLKEEAAKATRSGFTTLLFISSRRLPYRNFLRVEDEIAQTSSIKLQKMDVQDIASLALDHGFEVDILKAHGIAVAPADRRAFERPRYRRDAAYACAFFGSDARELRKVALQETICTVLTNADGRASRDSVVDQVALSLGLAANQRSQVVSSLDRLLQEGRIKGKNGDVTLEDKELGTRRSIQALAEADMNALRAHVDAYLEPFVKKKARLEAVRESIIEDIGALLMDTAARTSAAAADASAFDGVRARLAHLQSTLDSVGVDGDKRKRAVGDLARIASESQFGKHLLAGEIVLQLFHLRTSHLLRALEGRDAMSVVLDTSIAMPMLCNLLYAPVDQQYFVAARHVYEQLSAHGIPMLLPRDYLEEFASHLIEARDYMGIIDMDPDLRVSTNVFVAHYVAMKHADASSAAGFDGYLGAFGLGAGLAHGDFLSTRDTLMRRLERLLGQYHIGCEELRAQAAPRRRIEEVVTRMQREHELRGEQVFRRPKVVLDHDINTLGWLVGREADAHHAHVLCTWDRLHFEVRKEEQGDWDVLDPIALGDLLSLAASEDDEVHLASPWVLALRFSEEDAARGAEVWDTLVRIEQQRMHDAALREQARAFKAAWLAEITQDQRARDLQQEWERWKSEHLPPR